MNQKRDNESREQQALNLQFSEERLQLLDTIREIVNDELNRRGVNRNEGDRGCNDKPPNSEIC